MKTYYKTLIKDLPKILCVMGLLIFIMIHPESATNGIKNGISLLLTIIIPSLFPFPDVLMSNDMHKVQSY